MKTHLPSVSLPALIVSPAGRARQGSPSFLPSAAGQPARSPWVRRAARQKPTNQAPSGPLRSPSQDTCCCRPGGLSEAAGRGRCSPLRVGRAGRAARVRSCPPPHNSRELRPGRAASQVSSRNRPRSAGEREREVSRSFWAKGPSKGPDDTEASPAGCPHPALLPPGSGKRVVFPSDGAEASVLHTGLPQHNCLEMNSE